MGWTPCDEVDETLPIGEQHRCPYSEDPTSEMCAQCDWEHNERELEEEDEPWEVKNE